MSSNSPAASYKWTQDELRFFEVSFNLSQCRDFFGIDELPDPSPRIRRPVLEYTTLEDWQRHWPLHDEAAYNRDSLALSFFDWLGLSSSPRSLGGFVSMTLSETSTLYGSRTLSCRGTAMPMSILMSGQRVDFRADHAIISALSEDVLIPLCVAATDFGHATVYPPATDFDREMGARVVGYAVAAFQMVNAEREQHGLVPLPEALIPGMAWFGPSPAFLKVNVTKDLSDAVAAGVRPSMPTVVDVYLPPTTQEEKRYAEGMWDLELRYNTMRCLQAFGRFISQDVYGLLHGSERYKSKCRSAELRSMPGHT